MADHSAKQTTSIRSSDGMTEISAALTPEAFHATKTYKEMPIAQQKTLDDMIALESKKNGHSNPRLLIQSDANSGKSEKVYFGNYFENGGYPVVFPSQLLNLSDGKVSEVKEGFRVDSKTALPQQKEFDSFIDYIRTQEKTDQNPPAQLEENALAAALKKGTTSELTLAIPNKMKSNKISLA